MCFLPKGRPSSRGGASCLFHNRMRLRQSFPRPTHPANSRFDWLFAGPGLLLIFLLALPLLALFLRAAGNHFLIDALSSTALQALRLSLVTSLISVSLSVLVGTPLAYVLARSPFPGRSTVELLMDLPVVLPPSVAGLALLIAFGRQGMVGSLLAPLGISLPFTTAAVVMAQMFVSAPLFVRSARVGFAGVDPQLEEAALVEGANQWQMFRDVMAPLAGKALVSGAMMTWMRALGEFGATILFAGNLPGVTQTMPLAIYLGFERNLDVAVVLSVELVLVSVMLLVVTKKLDGHKFP